MLAAIVTTHPSPVHYLPIATTLVSVIFLAALLRRARSRSWAPHLVWWALGVLFFGIGTGLEASITLFGNTVALNKAWYIAGAVFGGYPLAQGSVHLLLPRKIAWRLTVVSLLAVTVVSILVLLSPANTSAMETAKPTGAVLSWTWVRWCTPFINIYAVIFLIGGTVWSAAKYFAKGDAPSRAIGNVLIATGATLPAIGGSMTKAGVVEALYIGEFLGLLLICAGYVACVRVPRPAATAASPAASPA